MKSIFITAIVLGAIIASVIYLENENIGVV
jgi:hypothetical protein